MMAERKLITHPRGPKAIPCAGTLIFFSYAFSVYCVSVLGQCFPGMAGRPLHIIITRIPSMLLQRLQAGSLCVANM